MKRALSAVSGMCGGLTMSSVTGQAIGRAPSSSARSAPENAATTPSACLAAVRSTFSMRACAMGERTTYIHSIPGSAMLST